MATTCAVLICLPQFARAQRASEAIDIAPGYMYRQWSVEEGLPVKSVTDLHQDERGFLWIATFSGLARFDGLHFELFQADKYPGLPNNRIVDISASPAGFLILLTESGDGAYFDGKKVVNISRDFELGRINSTGQTQGSALWLYGEKGVVEIDAGAAVTPVDIDLPGVYGSIEDSQSNFLIGSRNGFYRYEGGLLQKPLTEANGLPSRDVRSIVEDGLGDLILATAKGVVRLSGTTVTPIRAMPSQPQPSETTHLARMGSDLLVSTDLGWRRIEGNYLSSSFSRGTFPSVHLGIFSPTPAVDSQGNFWFASEGNVYRNDVLVLKSEGQVRTVYADKKSGVWIGHNTHGLMRIVPAAVSVTNSETGLPGENVYGLVSDSEQRTWAGLLDAAAFVRIDGDKVDMTVPMGTPWAAGKDPQGDIWLGGERLCKVAGNRCIAQTEPPINSAVRAIYTDSQGRFWIGTESELWLREEPEGQWKRVTDENDSRAWVRTIYEGADGTIFLGTFGKGVGFYRDGKVEFWNQLNGFPSDNVRSFYQPEPGVLWIGTEDKGLIQSTDSTEGSPAEPTLSVLDSRSGLPDNSVHAILVDSNGRIWANSNNGIYTFEREDADSYWSGNVSSIAYELFDNRKGLLNQEGNGGMQSAGFVDNEGRLHFPTQGGIAVVDPKQVLEILPPVVWFETISTSLRTLDADGVGTIQLSPEEVDIRIGFSAPFFDSPEDLRFRYRLVGYTEAWTELGPESQLQVTNMPPGEFTLVLESGLAGKWTRTPATLIIHREPSFQESIWFLVFLVAFGMTSGILLIFGRSQVIKRQKERLEVVVRERTATISAQAEKLSTLDEMKTRFFTNVSHELRTPLTLIKAPLSKLLDQDSDNLQEDAKNQLHLVDRSVDKLQHLVNQILDLSALEAGKTSLDVSTSDIGRFVSDQVDTYRTAASIRHVSFEILRPIEPVIWTFDALKLEWVLANLLSNALKFSPDNSKITILLKTEVDQLILSVQDEGPGIDSNDLPHVLDRYYQGTSRHADVGSGIGLSVTKEVVELHGGRIEVDSTLGKGSRFTIFLPRLESQDSQTNQPIDARVPVTLAATPPAEATSRDSDRSINDSEREVILVAEDNTDLLSFISDVLSELYDVVPVTNGQKALHECTQSIPDLVITDLMMPEMDGMELCAQLKSNLATSHIPVVMLTASSDTKTMSAGLHLGADLYLTKPFETPKLLAYVSSLLENRKRLRNAYSHRLTQTSVPDSGETLISLDEQFVERLHTLIHDQLSDPSFRVESLAEQMYLSSRQFLRKVEALTGETPSLLLRRIRLEIAATMIMNEAHNLKEISYAVGFNSTSGFRKAFKQHFGVPPSEWSAKQVQ